MTMRDEHLECLRCRRVLVAYKIWAAATREERRVMKAAGKARGCRRDLCAACYQYLRIHGLLKRYTAATRRAKDDVRAVRCVRCGQGTPTFGELCRDCADVTFDLDEREVWTA